MRVLALAGLVLALTAAPAVAAPVSASSHLWATVNACDSPDRPDAIGIRASMPGTGRRETLYMRFRVQLFDAVSARWRFIERGADSGRRRIGTVVNRRLESGYDFRFQPPEAGTAYTLRGHVTFYWRRGGRTVRRIREVTESGHRSTKGADPPDFSAGVCRIS